VADPGAEFVVFFGVHAGDAGADFLYPTQKLARHALVDFLACGGVTSQAAS